MISKKIAKKMQNMVLQILWALGRLLNGNIRPNWIDSSLWEISFFSSIAMTASLRSDNPAGQSIDVFSNSFDFMMSIVEINIIVYVYRPSMKRHLLLRLFISFFVVVLFFIFISSSCFCCRLFLAVDEGKGEEDAEENEDTFIAIVVILT